MRYLKQHTHANRSYLIDASGPTTNEKRRATHSAIPVQPRSQSECWMGPDLICSCSCCCCCWWWVYEILRAQFKFSPLRTQRLISHKDHARERESQQLLHTLGKTRGAFLVTVTQIVVKYRRDLARLIKIVVVNRCYKQINKLIQFFIVLQCRHKDLRIPQKQLGKNSTASSSGLSLATQPVYRALGIC